MLCFAHYYYHYHYHQASQVWFLPADAFTTIFNEDGETANKHPSSLSLGALIASTEGLHRQAAGFCVICKLQKGNVEFQVFNDLTMTLGDLPADQPPTYPRLAPYCM